MVDFSQNVALTATLRNQLLAIQKTARQVDIASGRLASGKKVNSALDDPNNFFASTALQSEASDFGRLLDGLGQNIEVLRQAQNGLSTIENLLELAESISNEAIIAAGGPSSNFGVPLPQQILDEIPDAYWQLDDINGSNNQGSIVGVDAPAGAGVTFGQPPIYEGGGTSARFDGSAGAVISVPDSNDINLDPVPFRTVELTFNADEVTSRQVLYEEGATVNSVGIYIDNGRIYTETRDAGDFGPFGISAPIEAGETYHVSFVIDSASNEFRGYLNGDVIGTGTINGPLAAHSGDIGIGGARGGLWFHDGPNGSSGFNFSGLISDVALYNRVLNDDVIRSHADATQDLEIQGFENDLNEALRQIELLALDSSYRGTNLLNGDSIVSVFNPDKSSTYTTQGDDFTIDGLNLEGVQLDSVSSAQDTLIRIRSAIDRVRDYQRTFATDVNVISTREDFTRGKINTNLAGSDKLVLANLDEESAKLLTAQTRQSIQFSGLASTTRLSSLITILFDNN